MSALDRIPRDKDPEGIFQAALSEGVPLLTEDWAAREMPPKPASSNKGTFGRAVLFAGSALYPGAALLAAKACLAGGCGLLTVYSAEEARVYLARLPEAIFRTGYSLEDASGAIRGADAVLAGPGWGEGEYGDLLREALLHAKALLIDADGLNFISRRPEMKQYLSPRAVLTPHPGEMARLTGESIPEITADPVGTARRYASLWNCTVLLKGACTVIASPEKTAVTAAGSCALAKGGSGDVLSGLITAMLCRGKAPFEAACLGSLLLGMGADGACRLIAERMMRAEDITEYLLSF